MRTDFEDADWRQECARWVREKMTPRAREVARTLFQALVGHKCFDTWAVVKADPEWEPVRGAFACMYLIWAHDDWVGGRGVYPPLNTPSLLRSLAVPAEPCGWLLLTGVEREHAAEAAQEWLWYAARYVVELDSDASVSALIVERAAERAVAKAIEALNARRGGHAEATRVRTSDDFKFAARRIAGFIRRRGAEFSEAAEWYRSLPLPDHAGDGEAPAAERLSAAWRAATNRYDIRPEGELAHDLDDREARRLLLVFALIFDERFDGAVVGLKPIPYDFDHRNPASVLAARNSVWQTVSPPTGGDAWVRKLWRVRGHAERIVGVTRRSLPGDASQESAPPLFNGEVNGGLQRLLGVQRRVRQLALEHDWFADAIRTATMEGFPALHAAYLSAVGGKRPPYPRPDDPPDPWSSDVADLRKFKEDDRRKIWLFRLGGLADLNNVDPIVAEPQDAGLAAAWNERMPVLGDDESKGPDPRVFPPALAETMLEAVKLWVTRHRRSPSSEIAREMDGAESGGVESRTVAEVRRAADHLRTLATWIPTLFPRKNGEWQWHDPPDDAWSLAQAKNPLDLTRYSWSAVECMDSAVRLLGITDSEGAPARVGTVGVWEDWVSPRFPTTHRVFAERVFAVACEIRTWHSRLVREMTVPGRDGIPSYRVRSAASEWARDCAARAEALGASDEVHRAGAAVVDLNTIELVVQSTAEKVALAFSGDGSPSRTAIHARTEVVLWEGAEHSERNVRLARTRSAYLEANGNVVDAVAALKAGGNEISRRTFYNHLDALDEVTPHWRDSVQLCNKPAQMHGTRNVGTRGKSRGKAG